MLAEVCGGRRICGPVCGWLAHANYDESESRTGDAQDAELRSAAGKEESRPVKPDMRVSFAGLELVNPVIAASGTFGYGIEFEEIVSLERLGAIVTKGISLEPMAGHRARRALCRRRREC